MQEVKHAILHKMHPVRNNPTKQSSVSLVECYVCGNGLQDGHSITAKTLPHGTVLFCDVHYSLQ